MDVYQRTQGSPIIQPFRVGRIHVHAAMTHGVAEVIMPVRTVDTVAFIEIHRIRHIRQIIAIP